MGKGSTSGGRARSFVGRHRDDLALLGLVLLLLALFLSPQMGRHVAEAGELLQNGGFEQATEGAPDDWEVYDGELTQAASPVRSGSAAACLASNTASVKRAYQVVSVTAGERYVLSGYGVKDDPNIQSVFLRISWYALEGGWGGEISHHDFDKLVDNDPAYRPLTKGEAVLAPQDAHSARVQLYLDPVSENEVRAYFDDLSFVSEATKVFLPLVMKGS